MLRQVRAAAVAAMLLVLLAACTVARVATPDPEAIPSGEPVAQGAEPTGPITVLGSGRIPGAGWRYLIYESADGWCTELQMIEVTSTGCGPDPLPAEGDYLGASGAGSPLESGVTPVDGVASAEIFSVSIVDEETGLRVPAIMMPLEDAGLEGQAFLAFTPADFHPTHIQGLARSGEILQTYELP